MHMKGILSTIINLYGKLILFLVITISQPLEYVSLKMKYGYCKILREGNGILNKYIIKKKRKKYLLKKANILTNHYRNIPSYFGKPVERSLSERFYLINEVISKKYLGNANLCIKATENSITYLFIDDLKEITAKNFPKKEIQQIIQSMNLIHDKGYRNKDFRFQNIIYDGKKCYLIDIDRLEKSQSKNDFTEDFSIFIRSILDKDIKHKVVSILKEEHIQWKKIN